MKSDVSDYLRLITLVYKDMCSLCPVDVSDVRDLETIRSRVEKEGLSFLTIVLPRFCRDFERSLADEEISASSFRNFRKLGSYPAFLQGMIGCLFNRETGRMYDDNRISSADRSTIVDCVRQICLTFKKLELECTPKRIQAEVENFVETERSFNEFSPSNDDISEFLDVSSVLWHDLIYRIRDCEFVPRHGPGGTAERISGNQKYAWKYWHERLDNYFSFFNNAYIYSAVDSKEFELVTFLRQDQEFPVRVIPVPKTLKAPRIIAAEPVCMQYAQQGIRNILYDAIESDRLTRLRINFRRQDINQALARRASSDGRFATIDLSNASDRVPRDLALRMFDSYPEFRDAIDSCRSTQAILPDGRIIGPLRKFASMGSALCFPVEAMYFYTICVMASLRKLNLPLSPRNALRVSRDIYVYGDDIIVPSTHTGIVLDYLQKYNCKVNTAKTFWTGKFRESCGMDCFDGYSVTPIYIKCSVPKNKRRASDLISFVKTATLFYKKGLWSTAQYMYSCVEKLIGPLPYVSDESPGLGRFSFRGYRSISRWNVKLQRFEVKAWCPTSVYTEDRIEGYAALQKCLLNLEDLDIHDLTRPSTSTWDEHRVRDLNKGLSTYRPSHLERSALHGAVALQLRWVPSY